MRRKFVAALEAGDKKHAKEAIVHISKLYKVESDADEAKLAESQRKALRQKISLLVINVFEKWMLTLIGPTRTKL